MTTMMTDAFTKIWEIRYRDIDPDTGLESNDDLVCIGITEATANGLRKTIERDYMECESNPNREFYVEEVILSNQHEIQYYDSELSDALKQKIYQFYGKNSIWIKQISGVDLDNYIKVNMVVSSQEILGVNGDLYDRLTLFLREHFKKMVHIHLTSS